MKNEEARVGGKKRKKFLTSALIKHPLYEDVAGKNNEPVISSFPRLNRARRERSRGRRREKEETKRWWRRVLRITDPSRPSFDPVNLFVDDLIIGIPRAARC